MSLFPATPEPTDTGSTAFADLLAWPFPDQPYYSSQVRSVLEDLPLLRPDCAVWRYVTDAGVVVAFGTLDVANEYAVLTSGLSHLFIPVLGSGKLDLKGCRELALAVAK